MRGLPKGRRAYAELLRMLARADSTCLEAQAGKGNAPGRKSPGEPGTPHAEKSGDGAPQPAEG